MTREEIGEKLKAKRISCGMTQQEVAEKIGRKQPIVGHWETGYSQPDANTLFMLCDIYGTTVDDVFGFSPKENFTKSEYTHIKKYRELDPHGKEMVDFTLQKEWERSVNAKNVPDYLKPVAARNDYENEPGQEEKMREDVSNLKKPD